MSTTFDDADFPAYTMGRAAEMIGVTPAFLRSLGAAGLIEPERSHGGHRRYSRHQLQLAQRVRQLLDEGYLLTAACRIVTLEDRLAAAHRRIIELGGTLTPDDDADIPTQTHPDIAKTQYYSA
ncbi:MerR family transcriptional regulator [Paractinoplanes abujensis]|uniref:DNA-binding transcriptional MerR regulator n=1 Tax=Paractinoplanes abujensis TaxID=882441 RepID=A0A7W7G6D9_9ACTN|nr:MerR family transcriptional regulator [Actinoplanes abujensis]MBB4697330.1 DNA-binding transcriptional MerR regulator [Actinoplanes abujensis]GID18194.1 MerR family transcriptional regulator [Actinoplanes abujensis]